MTPTVTTIGAIGLAGMIALFVRFFFVRHDPERAAASVTVAANVPFELQLPGSPGKLFFRFNIKGDTEFHFDLLVSGEIVDERGGTRAFAVKTSPQSSIDSADSARYASTRYAGTTSAGSISLATVDTGDRAVRGVVAEHPSGLLRKGWVYVPGERSALAAGLFRRRTASHTGPAISSADFRVSGQRVRGVLKSFTATGETMRSRGVIPKQPEFLGQPNHPYYALVVDLQLPDLAPVEGRNRQPVPLIEVPDLAIGKELNCAVDPADPANRFIVLWSDRPPT